MFLLIDVPVTAITPVLRAPGVQSPIVAGIDRATGFVGETITASVSGDLGSPAGTITYQWKLGGVDIGGATAGSYLTTATGSLTVVATVTNGSGNASATSPAAVITPVPTAPFNQATPAFTGTPTSGQTLTVSENGNWGGYPTPTVAINWQRDGTDIIGATANTYLVQAGDAGHFIGLRVGATNSVEYIEAYSATVEITIAAAAPVNLTLPTIAGVFIVGGTVLGADGTWSGEPAPTLARNWQRNTVDIPGATGSTYVFVDADEGASIRLRVTATNATAAVPAYSTPVVLTPAAIFAAQHFNQFNIPMGFNNAMSGVAVGHLMVVSLFNHQSLTIPDLPAGHTNVDTSSANSSSARVSWKIADASDVGAVWTAPTATRGGMLVITDFDPTDPIGSSSGWLAENDTTPGYNALDAEGGGGLILGFRNIRAVQAIQTYPGMQIIVSHGNSNCSIQAAVSAAGGPISGFPGVRDGPYTTIPTGDLNAYQEPALAGSSTGSHTLLLEINAARVVTTFAPANVILPTISGTPTVGQTLTATSDGTWAGNPTPTLARKWQRDGVDIASATATTYVLVTADAGHQISVLVTGTNTAGSASASSNSVFVASLTFAPVNTVLPTITGTPTVGQTLTAADGTWTGTPTPTLARKWQRNGVDIGGATATTYVLQAADAGTQVGVLVTGTNTAGAANAASDTVTVAAITVPPVNTVLPSITGTPTVGQTLTAADGTWTGTPTPTLTRNWQRDGVNISGATATTYLLVAGDATHQISVLVTGTNTAGSANAGSNSVTIGAAAQAPVNTVAPTISGTGTIGQTLTATSDGTWTGTPTPTLARNWQRNGVDISGATGATYVLQVADSGQNVRLRVRGTNTQGVSDGFSTAIAVAAGTAPVNTVAPTRSGGVNTIGGTVTATSDGTWTGTPTPTLARNWQRNGVDIPGETGTSYVLAAADGGQNVRFRVTGTNAFGTATGFCTQLAVTAEASAPVNTGLPTISGSVVQGGLLTGANGIWTGNPTSFAYQWQRNGVDIASATSSTYTSVLADVGNAVRLRVTATNIAGSAAAFSAAVTITGTVDNFENRTLTPSNYLTVAAQARTRATRYLFTPGIYPDFLWPTNINDFPVQIVPSDRNNPPTIRCMAFITASSSLRGNLRHLANAPSGTTFRNITIDGLNFLAQRFTQGEDSGGTNHSFITGTGAMSDAATEGGIGWRVCGITTHPSYPTGFSENGIYRGLTFGSNVCDNIEVKNCLFDGYSAQMYWSAGSGSLNCHHNTFYNCPEDMFKWTAGDLWFHHNFLGHTRTLSDGIATWQGGPVPPHPDAIQQMAPVNDMTFEDNVMNNVFPGRPNHLMHGGLIRNASQTGRSRRLIFRRNEIRTGDDTGILISDIEYDGGSGIAGSNLDFIITGNKCWTGGAPFLEGNGPVFGFENYTTTVAPGGTRGQFSNNVGTRINNGAGTFPNNTQSNSEVVVPTGWVWQSPDKVAPGQPFAGRYGATAGVVSG